MLVGARLRRSRCLPSLHARQALCLAPLPPFSLFPLHRVSLQREFFNASMLKDLLRGFQPGSQKGLSKAEEDGESGQQHEQQQSAIDDESFEYTNSNLLVLKDSDTGTTCHVLGTVHNRSDYEKQMRNLITELKPDSIMIEMCEAREKSIKKLDPNNPMLLFDCSTALRLAREYGIPVVYGDRPESETLKKVISVGAMELLRFKFKPPPPAVQNALRMVQSGAAMNGDRKEARKLLQILRQHLPRLYNVIIADRDEFMVDTLKRRCVGPVVLGVVGAAHLDGIERIWHNHK